MDFFTGYPQLTNFELNWEKLIKSRITHTLNKISVCRVMATLTQKAKKSNTGFSCQQCSVMIRQKQKYEMYMIINILSNVMNISLLLFNASLYMFNLNLTLMY